MTPFMSVTSFSETIHLALSAPATLAFFLFLEHARCVFHLILFLTYAISFPEYNSQFCLGLPFLSPLFKDHPPCEDLTTASYLDLCCRAQVSSFP